MELGRFGGGFCLFIKGDKSIFRLGEIIISGKRGGGAEDARDFGGMRHETSQAERGIFGGVFLEIGGFVGLVDNNKAEVVNGGEKGRTGADDNLGSGGI